MLYRWLLRTAAMTILGGTLGSCSDVPSFAADWRLTACYAQHPGVTLIEAFEVRHVSDLFPRLAQGDRERIVAGTDERPAFVVRLRGTLKLVQADVGPLPGGTFEADHPTCLIVGDADGTYSRAAGALLLGPFR